MTSKKQGIIRQLVEAPAPTEAKQASGLPTVSREADSVKVLQIMVC
jgi:hypothetical protein